ncbi:MAG: glycosyltransferase family 4 protein [bacterium]
MSAISELFSSTILLLPRIRCENYDGLNVLEGNNLKVIPLTCLPGSDFKRKMRFPYWFIKNIRTIISEIRSADAVHAVIPGDIGMIGMLLALFFRKRLFVRHCGNWLKPGTMADYFLKWAMEHFANERNIMFATGGGPNPPSEKNSSIRWIFATSLSKKEIDKLARKRDILNRDIRLIIVCRQENDKGTLSVIKCMPHIHSRYPNVFFDIVGDGSSLSYFKKAAVDMNISKYIVFHGNVNHNTVKKLLDNADLMCFPTNSSEGFPKAVHEALSCGLPVITTPISVLPFLIGTGCGIIVKDTSPNTLSDAVCRLISNPDEYRAMSEQALKTAVEYSLESWRDTIGDCLKASWGQLNSGL